MVKQSVILSWSGGKDCLMALERLRDDPTRDVVGLLTTVNQHYDRIATHGIRRTVLNAQAAALGLPLVVAAMEFPGSNDTYIQAWRDALQQARQRWPRLRHVAFGDIYLKDVRAWREQQMHAAGWEAVFPLWAEDTKDLARGFIKAGHRAHLACVDLQQFDAACCGSAFDDAFLDALPAQVDPCGENGEFHTLSHGGPLFAVDLALTAGVSVLCDQRFQFQDFLLVDG